MNSLMPQKYEELHVWLLADQKSERYKASRQPKNPKGKECQKKSLELHNTAREWHFFPEIVEKIYVKDADILKMPFKLFL